jgi:anhydro-N-acetylmuramic acid kinase
MQNITNTNFKVIGLMSGTSLDGLDIAYCEFYFDTNKWNYKIVEAQTINYSLFWKEQLIKAENCSALDYNFIHQQYGAYLGQRVSDFIVQRNLRVDFVASHGHTIFHQPEKKLTVQIGSGAAIAAACKLPVVCDFRSVDVALGGQGAPLVPIGDLLLFSEFDFCVNLGGFANISYQHKGERIAFDVCPVNIVLNELCKPFNIAFDNNGNIARSGMLSHYLFNELNQLGFYKATPDSPKSLGKEWVSKHIHPLIDMFELANNDLLHTFCEHIAFQLAKIVNTKPKGKMLITGGGVFNGYLMERIVHYVQHQVIVPNEQTVAFKEALLFAFLAVLRWNNQVNCLKSVTGAASDNIGGAIYFFDK